MNIEQARFNMIEQQIRTWDVLDQRVLEALEDVPREEFVPEASRSMAFVDMNIPLPHDQVMLQPKVEARLIQELALAPTDKVLEIGTGSAHMTALLATLAGEVDTVDIFPDFIESAREKLAAQDIHNVEFFEGDAARGWEGGGPYDAILLTGSVPILPQSYKEQLNSNGHLIVIVGQDPIMETILIQRLRDGAHVQTSLFDTSLPALINAETPSKFVF